MAARKTQPDQKSPTLARRKTDVRYPTIESDLSASIVHYLQEKQHKTLKEIGDWAGGLSESYISRVGKGERNFRLDHLVHLERALGKPLPLLLLEAAQPKSLNEGMRAFYADLKEIYKVSTRIRSRWMQETE